MRAFRGCGWYRLQIMASQYEGAVANQVTRRKTVPGRMTVSTGRGMDRGDGRDGIASLTIASRPAARCLQINLDDWTMPTGPQRAHAEGGSFHTPYVLHEMRETLLSQVGQTHDTGVGRRPGNTRCLQAACASCVSRSVSPSDPQGRTGQITRMAGTIAAANRDTPCITITSRSR